MAELADVVARLGRDYADLSPKLRRAAKFAIDMPTEIALGSLRDIAERAGVAPTTLIRLAQQVGFPTYDEFRAAFRNQVRHDGGAYAQRAVDLQDATKGRAASAATDVLASAQANLALTARALTSESVQAAAETLLRAKRLLIIGMRSAYAAAFYAYYLAKLIRTDVELIEGRAGMLVDDVGECNSDDAVIAISLRPYPSETVAACRHVVECGAKLLAITDSKLSPIAQGATHVFLTPSASTSFYISFVPTLLVIEALFAAVAAEGGRKVVNRLKRQEMLRESFGIYWKD